MVTTEDPLQTNIGKLRFGIKPSAENPPQWQHRSEALAAWLLSQWYKRQAERN